jgi:hypothetical protein
MRNGFVKLLRRTVQRIKALDKRCGEAINPATPAAVLEEILPDLDQVPLLSVNPDSRPRRFLHSMVPKIHRVSQMIRQMNSSCKLGIDGGIDDATALPSLRWEKTYWWRGHPSRWQHCTTQSCKQHIRRNQQTVKQEHLCNSEW